MIQTAKMTTVFSFSMLGHFLYIVFLVVFVRQIPGEVISLTPLGVNPLPIYISLIIIGHLLVYFLPENQPRVAMVLYVAMVYTALVLSLILYRLSSINYG